MTLHTDVVHVLIHQAFSCVLATDESYGATSKTSAASQCFACNREKRHARPNANLDLMNALGMLHLVR